ncbi:MAG TPA: MazG nucleotide pyrophosphohydrolase domain-containing protein [Candidatus Lokiarchaeia archaeon]|nr:MazG nucleotide pyrophosphohydrolase domain-containing protein [Candidatus Lokiarchaeia archaeon]
MEFSEFQALIRELYFEKDTARGALGTFTWLVEEMGEVAEIVKRKEVEIGALGPELADVIAWTFSLANIFGIEMEQAILEKYPHKCGKCGQIPCTCEE